MNNLLHVSKNIPIKITRKQTNATRQPIQPMQTMHHANILLSNLAFNIVLIHSLLLKLVIGCISLLVIPFTEMLYFLSGIQAVNRYVRVSTINGCMLP